MSGLGFLAGGGFRNGLVKLGTEMNREGTHGANKIVERIDKLAFIPSPGAFRADVH